jgi:hypothetical protein
MSGGREGAGSVHALVLGEADVGLEPLDGAVELLAIAQNHQRVQTVDEREPDSTERGHLYGRGVRGHVEDCFGRCSQKKPLFSNAFKTLTLTLHRRWATLTPVQEMGLRSSRGNACVIYPSYAW